MLRRCEARVIGSEKLTAQPQDHGLESELGPGWKDVVGSLWRSEHLTSEALAGVYVGARILLNSHMPQRVTRGFMSDRSYDALASGALTVSDRVPGFHDPGFPEIRQVAGQEVLVSTLKQLPAAPPVGLPDPIAPHDRVASRYRFDKAAGVVLDRARALISNSFIAVAAYAPGRSGCAIRPRYDHHALDPALVGSADRQKCEYCSEGCDHEWLPPPGDGDRRRRWC
ncbi:hypothetical protein M3484_21800 [Pseudomonas sp. GX19020]|uniref:glycosyltransferase family protein n=1 Tax=Pseudomonas sp. GX19020 TaxID=2942277 RepID=UPI002018D5C9|nr:hypothetical protein [Pseudomonas sp. GX19020]MCL4069196.1 hypothetical protein [Pseudomonas sp. GX19020]